MRAGRQIYNPDGFKNIGKDGSVIGYEFQFKVQYHSGVPLSNIRDIQIWVDGRPVSREDIRFTINETTFTLKEMRKVIESGYYWEYGDYATVSVMKEGGLAKGSHHISAMQIIAPSYMPFMTEALCETDFVIE